MTAPDPTTPRCPTCGSMDTFVAARGNAALDALEQELAGYELLLKEWDEAKPLWHRALAERDAAQAGAAELFDRLTEARAELAQAREALRQIDANPHAKGNVGGIQSIARRALADGEGTE